MMPTQREIAARFGFSSLNAVRSHLRLMEKKKIITRIPGKARGLKLKSAGAAGIPIMGRIAAGVPLLAIQDADEIVPMSPQFFGGDNLFGLRVSGESMKNAGILPGDVAIMNRQEDVSNGEIAAVLLKDEATLKFFFSHQGTVVLKGANPAFEDILIRGDDLHSLRILGRYVGLVRRQGGVS